MANDCDGCGIHYSQFRTGLTFGEVRQQFWRNDPDYKTWHPKRRSTVLGRWRQIKQALWGEHLNLCSVPF